MVTLTLIDPQTNLALKNWHFASESVIRVGRHPENDVVFQEYRQVSRHHLELRQIGQTSPSSKWELVSSSPNGTFVNEVLTNQALIEDNDLIRLSQNGPTIRFQISTKLSIPEHCNHQDNPPNSIFCQHCGEPIVEQEEFIRDFQLLRTLGKGGMGTTYLALDQKKDTQQKRKLIVIKEMNADMALIDKARELFEREARILRELHHPGIPRFYDFFVDSGKKYLAMELIHGENLEHRIHYKGPVTPQLAVEWMIQVCEILSYLHSLNPPLVHRDIKPANLLVRKVDNHVFLIDFGAVKEIGTPLGTRIGAEGYSAPEQNLGKPCPQSDLYAIGPTIIFLITGLAPLKFQAGINSDSNFDLTKIPSMTYELSKVINKVSQIKVRDRYQTAGELVSALRNCL